MHPTAGPMSTIEPRGDSWGRAPSDRIPRHAPRCNQYGHDNGAHILVDKDQHGERRGQTGIPNKLTLRYSGLKGSKRRYGPR